MDGGDVTSLSFPPEARYLKSVPRRLTWKRKGTKHEDRYENILARRFTKPKLGSPIISRSKKGEKGGQKKCVGDGGGRIVKLL